MDIFDIAGLTLMEIMYIINIYSEKTYTKGHVINRDKTYREIKKSSKWSPIDVRFKYSEKLEYFIKTIKEQLPYVDLTFMNNNLEDLKIAEYDKRGFKLDGIVKGSAGEYSARRNIVKLLKNEEEYALSHELLHMSSSFNQGQTLYSGFSQDRPKTKFTIGNGLNEGFTAYLDSKLFGTNEAYFYMQPYIQALIQIVGEENLTKYYFSADLNGLIQHLSTYVKESYIYKFIANTDKILDIVKKGNKNKKFNEKEQAAIDVITEENARILLNIFANKVKMENPDVKSADDVRNIINSFYDYANTLSKGIGVSNLTMIFITQKTYDEEMFRHFGVDNSEIEQKSSEETSVQHKM